MPGASDPRRKSHSRESTGYEEGLIRDPGGSHAWVPFLQRLSSQAQRRVGHMEAKPGPCQVSRCYISGCRLPPLLAEEGSEGGFRPLPPPHAQSLARPPVLSHSDTVTPPGCPAHMQGYSRDQKTPGAPGQSQAGDKADDQVQDEEQEVGKPSG